VHWVPVVHEELCASQFDWTSAVSWLVKYCASVGYLGRLKLGRCIPVQLDNSVRPPEILEFFEDFEFFFEIFEIFENFENF